MKKFKLKSLFSVIIVGLFIVFGTIIVALVNYHMKQQAFFEAESKAQIITDLNLSIHTYFSRRLKPKVFEMSDRFHGKKYFEPAWMSSTFAIRETFKYFKDLIKAEYYYKECAINARSPENEADEYEKKFIEELNSNPDITKQTAIRSFKDKPHLVVLRRGEAMEKSCLRCHSTPRAAPRDMVKLYGSKRSFNRSEGEVVSAISIRIPLKEAYGKANYFSYVLSSILIGTLFILLLTIMGINNYFIFSPIKLLRDKVMLISKDRTHLGDKIPVKGGEELENVIESFNTMSEELHDLIFHLEDIVEDRTSEIVESNEKLNESLSEKEVLLKEIHHRVKNNFQLISSLVCLKEGSLKDESTKEVLREVQNKIQSMAFIHEKLYQSETLSTINFSEYITFIINELRVTYQAAGKKCAFEINVGEINIDIKQAIPCGLIINELISNSLKYAFPEEFTGEAVIHISMNEVENSLIELIVSDNGIGIQENLNLEEMDSLGLQIVYSCGEKQIKGKISIDTNQGTTFTLKFKKL